MADQQFLASFGVDIDESGVSRLQKILSENRTMAESLSSAFDTASESVKAFRRQVATDLPTLFSGALITETLFSIPGIGYTSYHAMVSGDIPFSMFYLAFLAILTLLGNLIADILYAVVDPRVRIA